MATLRDRVFQVFGSQILDDLLDLGDRNRDLNMPLEQDAPPNELAAARRPFSPAGDSAEGRKSRS